MTTPGPGPGADPEAPSTPPINVGPDRMARAIRNSERGRAPQLTLRQGTIVSGPTSGTYTVTIGADPTEISGVRAFSYVTAAAGDSVFLLLNGGDVIILGKLAT